MEKYINNVTNASGDVIAGAQILVTALNGTNAIIYATDGGSPVTNPLISGENGYFEFYANDGQYKLTVSGPGIKTFVIADIRLSDSLPLLTEIKSRVYGPLTADPALDPRGNAPTVGDEYYNTGLLALKRFNGATWLTDISPTSLAAVNGTPLFGYPGDEIQAMFDEAKPLQGYTALRAYTGRATGVRITTPGIAGLFQRSSTDTTSADNGGTVIVDAGGGRWLRLISGEINVLWFGAIGNGVADDTAAENAALLFCSISPIYKTLFYPAGTYKRTAPYAFTSAYAGVRQKGDGRGRTIIKKAFVGSLGTVVSCPNFQPSEITFDGSQVSFPGDKGFIFSGTSHYPVIDQTVSFVEFGDAALEFGPDSGFRAEIRPVIFTVGLADFRAINLTGPDTTAMFRNLSGTSTNGYVQVTGTLDTLYEGGFCSRMVISATASITKSIGTIWGAGSIPIVIDGLNTVIVGCRLAQAVTLNAGMTGVFTSNVQTVAGFTNNSVSGNVLVHHHPPAAPFDLFGKHRMSVGTSVSEVQINVLQSLGDANYTWTPDGAPTFISASSPLTANRTITLSTTGARNGMALRVLRNGGDTGGPWTLAIGGTGKLLSNNQWCDVMFNGSFWLVTANGAL